jgi:signal peptidase II
MLTITIAIIVTILDQLVKWLVQTEMDLGETIPVIPHIFHLTYIHNPGAAFGILPHQEWFFLAIVVVLFGAYFVMRKKIPQKPVYFPMAVAMLLGGALGNAIDRVRYGSVVDFFDFRIWPIFNVADIFICVGVALIVFYFWRHN